MKSQIIQIQNQKFTLHPTGVMFWEEKSMLLIADPHLGKISHFRKHGSAVPQEAILKNFEQLDKVLQTFNPSTICFLGDLFHSYINNEWVLFSDWVSKTNPEILLIVGNHDIISPRKYEELDIKIGSELILDNFLLSHHPEEREGLFNFCGHIHPGVLLGGLGKQRLRLPCFYQKENQLILPAFGEFTGNYTLEPTEKVKIYAITKKEVILVHQ
ncbi:ligase-associated DNA damage response endonuclease PdeM [uncultured Aquimarina sp.]|uniref:ligase-associated DNA damage response endonuclease PdeM n=1 Tax=uncultured Aquimarina sp. TaxID=575652 RepID=UPI002609FA8C|nr:ligase-associated DNA damage response endonuclease PdeM [uncultured Aquimarina sp.]